MVLLHQIGPDDLVLHRAQLQGHAPGQNRRQKRVRIGRQQHDDAVGRRLLDGLQEGVLGLYGHLFGLVHDVNLIRTAVGLNLDIAAELAADVLHADAGGLLMGHRDDIRLIAAHSLLAGMAFPAGLSSCLLYTSRCV